MTPAPLDMTTGRAPQTLDETRPLGLARITGRFEGVAGHVDTATGLALTAQGLARIDSSARHPRLKKTVDRADAVIVGKCNRAMAIKLLAAELDLKESDVTPMGAK